MLAHEIYDKLRQTFSTIVCVFQKSVPPKDLFLYNDLKGSVIMGTC